jgi:hypothetical protein
MNRPDLYVLQGVQRIVTQRDDPAPVVVRGLGQNGRFG